MERIGVVIERHPDGFVAYPLGVRGVVVGRGETAEEARTDTTSALRRHVGPFGTDAREVDSPVLDAILADAPLATRKSGARCLRLGKPSVTIRMTTLAADGSPSRGADGPR